MDILNSKNYFFNATRATLDSRMKELTEMGLNVVNGSDTVTPQDEACLWDSGVFDLNTAKGLSFCVFFYNAKVFGLRGGQEHRDLTPDQFSIFDGADGRFIRYTSKTTKNVSEGLKTRKVVPRVIDHFAENDNERCIVAIYDKYLSLIPKEGSFYRKPLENKDGQIQFSSQNIGRNSLATYMKTMFSNAGINTEGR